MMPRGVWVSLVAASLALVSGCGGHTGVAELGGEGPENTDVAGSVSVGSEQGESADGVSGSSSGASEEDSEADTGAWFPGDQGGVCDQGCDPWISSTCDEGLKCVPVACELASLSWDTNVCVVILGNQQVGEPCISSYQVQTGQDDCREGAICWRFTEPEPREECIALCRGSASAPECPLGNHCVIPSDGIPAICLPDCDPLAQDCVTGDDLCVPDLYGAGFVCVLDASGGIGPRGTACDSPNSCNHGLVCAEADRVDAPGCDTERCCTPMCDTTAPNNCEGAAEQCISLEVPGSVVGACMIPEAP